MHVSSSLLIFVTVSNILTCVTADVSLALALLFDGKLDDADGAGSTDADHRYQELQKSLLELRDRQTIHEYIDIVRNLTNRKVTTSPSVHLNPQPQELCRNATYLPRITDSISRVLNYYEIHLDSLYLPDHAIGLSFVKVLEKKHGTKWHKSHQILDWVSKICSRYGGEEDVQTCLKIATILEPRDTVWNKWEPMDTLLEASKHFENVGSDRETIWSRINFACMEALVRRCEVPQVCRQTMYDPTPRSQYMLTHQLLHRIMTEMSGCLPEKKSLVSAEVNLQLCAKMYKEAELISQALTDVKYVLFGDLLSEYVAFCGFIGNPNFFRADWLETLLEMQSKSENGCFLEESLPRFISNNPGFPRKLTTAELSQGKDSSEEICAPHFTSVALAALTMYSDYIEGKCDFRE